MICRSSIFSLALVSALGTASLPAWAQWKYPDWSGRWTDLNTNRWDPAKPPNAGQQAPLIPEYQAKLDAAVANRAEGGRGNTPTI
ncbi:MAG TPA: hypothetical protein VGL31_16590, partial [Xanthobacteraceae bacterium]